MFNCVKRDKVLNLIFLSKEKKRWCVEIKKKQKAIAFCYFLHTTEHYHMPTYIQEQPDKY